MDWVCHFLFACFFCLFHFQRGRSDAPADDVCKNVYLLEISIDFQNDAERAWGELALGILAAGPSWVS